MWAHLSKMFLFEFQRYGSSEATIFVFFTLISGFVLAWAETWFLDFRVLPAIKKFRLQVRALERQPLVRSRGAHYGSFTPTGDFYSPYDSDGNDSEAESFKTGRTQPAGPGPTRHLGPKEQQYLAAGKEALALALQIAQAESATWLLEKDSADQTASVYSTLWPGLGKIFKLQTMVNLSTPELFEELYYNVEETPAWNPTVLHSKVLTRLDAHTDVQYSVAAEGGGGLVSKRDFVNVRRWTMRRGVYVAAGRAVEFDDMPPSPDYVRGENGIASWTVQPAEEVGWCLFTWILHTNLKGWMPQKVIDAALSTVLIDFSVHLHNHAADVRRSRQKPDDSDAVDV